MSRKNEEPQGNSSVSFHVPDFVGEDGIDYTDIEVIVEMDGDIRDAVNLAESLQGPLNGAPMKVARKRYQVCSLRGQSINPQQINC
jgi:hypothetical protein